MIRVNELKGKLTAKGMTQKELADKLGITQNTLRAKMQKGVFGSDEIEKMMEIFDISDPSEIFFAKRLA